MVHCICVYGTLYLYAWYIVFVMVCLCVVYYMCDGICDFNYYECVSSCVTWTIFMHGTVQSHLNQPQTLAPLLPAVRIWLHSVRGHVQMCSQSNRRLQQAAYITKTFRLCLTRFYEGKNHWTTNEHSCLAYLFFRKVVWTWPLTECSQILTEGRNGAKVGADLNEIGHSIKCCIYVCLLVVYQVLILLFNCCFRVCGGVF